VLFGLVMFGGAVTTSVPLTVGPVPPPWQSEPFEAVTVNGYAPGAVVVAVEMVRVLEKLAVDAVKGFVPPLNAGVAPVVSGFGETLKVTVQELVLPPIVTVVVYTA